MGISQLIFKHEGVQTKRKLDKVAAVSGCDWTGGEDWGFKDDDED